MSKVAPGAVLPPVEAEREALGLAEIAYENAMVIGSMVVALALGVAGLTLSLSIASNQDFASQSNEFLSVGQTFQTQATDAEIAFQPCDAWQLATLAELKTEDAESRAMMARFKAGARPTANDVKALERSLGVTRQIGKQLHDGNPACLRYQALQKVADNTRALMPPAPTPPSDLESNAPTIGLSFVAVALGLAVAYLLLSAQGVRYRRSRLLRLELEDRRRNDGSRSRRTRRPRLRAGLQTRRRRV